MTALVKETLFFALIHGYSSLSVVTDELSFQGGEDTFGDLPKVSPHNCFVSPLDTQRELGWD